MLILITALIIGTLLLTRTPRLAASRTGSRKKVHADVDGKPVDSYVKEGSDCV